MSMSNSGEDEEKIFQELKGISEKMSRSYTFFTSQNLICFIPILELPSYRIIELQRYTAFTLNLFLQQTTLGPDRKSFQLERDGGEGRERNEHLTLRSGLFTTILKVPLIFKTPCPHHSSVCNPLESPLYLFLSHHLFDKSLTQTFLDFSWFLKMFPFMP